MLWTPPTEKHCIAMSGRSDLPTVHLLHGYQSSKIDLLPLGVKINRRGYPVSLCDQRGHGTHRDGKKTDFEGMLADVRGRIIRDNRPVILIGHSMGGSGATVVGATEPMAKQAFVISSPNSEAMLNNSARRKFWRVFGIDDGAVETAMRIMPKKVSKCTPELQKKFYFIHQTNDWMVPFSEFQSNVTDFCVSETHTYIKKSYFGSPSLLAHILPIHSPDVESYIISRLWAPDKDIA